MRKIFVAITCGLSLLYNLLLDQEFVNYIRKFTNAEFRNVRDIVNDRELMQKLYRDSLVSGEVSKFVLSKLREDPLKMSAELNSLIKLLRSCECNDVDICRILLFSSDSPSCKFCTQLISKFIVENIQEFIKNRKISCEVKSIVTIPELSPANFDEVLQKLSDKFVREAYRHISEGYEMYTIITGGFKIEIAYITVLAFMLRSKVVYCPDYRSDVIILPPLPVDLGKDIVDLYDRVEKGLEADSLTLDKFVKLGLVSSKNGKIKLENWVKKLIEVRRWNYTS